MMEKKHPALKSYEIRVPRLWWPGILFLLLYCTACQLPAQKRGAIEEIRALYQQVNGQIARCTGPEDPCGYYLNTLVINKKEDPWPAVGTYQVQHDFWYTGGMTEEGMAHDLHKVNIVTQRSALLENEELLFDADGELVFYYFKLGDGEGSGQENRYYFSEGKLVDYKEKISEEEVEYQRWKKSDAQKVVGNSERLKKLFFATLDEN